MVVVLAAVRLVIVPAAAVKLVVVVSTAVKFVVVVLAAVRLVVVVSTAVKFVVVVLAAVRLVIVPAPAVKLNNEVSVAVKFEEANVFAVMLLPAKLPTLIEPDETDPNAALTAVKFVLLTVRALSFPNFLYQALCSSAHCC